MDTGELGQRVRLSPASYAWRFLASASPVELRRECAIRPLHSRRDSLHRCKPEFRPDRRAPPRSSVRLSPPVFREYGLNLLRRRELAFSRVTQSPLDAQQFGWRSVVRGLVKFCLNFFDDLCEFLLRLIRPRLDTLQKLIPNFRHHTLHRTRNRGQTEGSLRGGGAEVFLRSE